MKALKKITSEKEVSELLQLSHNYKIACASKDWRKGTYMEEIQMLLNSFKAKYNLTDAEWSTLYVKFVLS